MFAHKLVPHLSSQRDLACMAKKPIIPHMLKMAQNLEADIPTISNIFLCNWVSQ
jgi:hypothetical protein